jgi:restriction system protein
MQETRRITLLDLEALFDLWTRYYDELAEGDRKLLPLEPVFFLSPED